MNYKKVFGWGILIYAVMFLLWSGLSALGMDEGVLPRVISVIVIAGLALLAGKNLKTDLKSEIIKYSIGWAVIVAVLDAIFTVPFTGWSVFAEWSTLSGYALIVLMPLFFHGRASVLPEKEKTEETEPIQQKEPEQPSM